MAKFDVYRLRSSGGLVVDCQADLLDGLNTRLVVPLLPRTEAPLPAARLNPLFAIDGETYVMVTQFAAAIAMSELGEQMLSLSDEALPIGNALDMLICGF